MGESNSSNSSSENFWSGNALANAGEADEAATPTPFATFDFAVQLLPKKQLNKRNATALITFLFITVPPEVLKTFATGRNSIHQVQDFSTFIERPQSSENRVGNLYDFRTITLVIDDR